MRLTPLALAAALLTGGSGAFAQAADASPPLAPGRSAQPPAGSEEAKRQPVVLRARSLTARPDIETFASGDVEFRQGGTAISADELRYDNVQDLASARGHVRIAREGAIYSGPEMQLRVQRFEGFFLRPEFEFTEFGAGGRADRLDFLDKSRTRATNASYTSCPRDGSGDPDWVLRARRVSLDFDTNEGVAEGAVLSFLGAPILALPTMSFPLTSARRSGWLPPSINLDSRSGLELSVPYYWNIAPNHDATLVPRLITRRGLGLDTEFRYLEPGFGGTIELSALPNDRVAKRSRTALQWSHDGRLGAAGYYDAELVRVSDDGWWKDFPNAGRSLTPRLLTGRAGAEQRFGGAAGDGLVYARLQQWQVLQGSDQLVRAPYQRSPQVGVQFVRPADNGVEVSLQTEFNRFTLPSDDADTGRTGGWRLHALGSVARPWREPGWWVVPRLSFNAATYRTAEPLSGADRYASRVIPTASLEAGLEFERTTLGLGRTLRQTLEPRLLYVNTPYRQQNLLPNYDAAAKDFSFSSIFSENAFSGVDRVSDSHQVTAGVTTRLVDAANGVEALRLGLVQRYLLRTQRITAQPDGSADGEPLTQHFSDVLLLGSSSIVPQWTLDASLQYSPDISRPVRSVVGARWSPGPFRTLGATYRFARGLSEQLELGWQWPIRLPAALQTPASQAAASGVGAAALRSGGSGSCGGSWYTVGRVNYSTKDSRVTDSILGFEYDAGCWIGRIVAERLSTGQREATTRLLLQLELVGLSRLGSNPLKVLKDNIPGYRLLREDLRSPTPTEE